MNVTVPADGPAAVAVVREFLSRGDIAVRDVASTTVLWRQVRYSYAQLATIRDLVFDSVFRAGSGTVSLDLDEGTNRVNLGVDPRQRRRAELDVRALLARRGTDTAAVDVADRAPMRTTARMSGVGYFTWTNLELQADPVVAGLIVGASTPSPGWSCTIGFIADYAPAGGRGFVTASHCTRLVGGDIWGVDHYYAFQDPYGAFAGSEVADPGPWSCGIWQLCRRSDASFYLAGNRTFERGLIARPFAIGANHTPDASQPYFMIVGSADGYQGQLIWKVGRVSGWREGHIYATCVDHNLTGVNQGGAYERTVRCGNEADTFNDDGDSGGPLFLPAGGPFVYLSGTTVGRPGNTTFTHYSTISQIQLDFGNSLIVDRQPTLNAAMVSASIASGAPTLAWAPVAGATAYHVFKQVDGAGPFALAGTVSGNTFSDGLVAAASVLSGPPAGGPPYVAYYVTAASESEVSPSSNVVVFRPAFISVSIQGQIGVQPNEGCYWTATAQGGTGNYSYHWTVTGGGTFPDSPQVFVPTGVSSFTLALTVTDGANTSGNDQKFISVSYSNPSCQF